MTPNPPPVSLAAWKELIENSSARLVKCFATETLARSNIRAHH